jgi:sulfur-carrier protein
LWIQNRNYYAKKKQVILSVETTTTTTNIMSEPSTATIKIQVLFFASAREAAGDITETTIELTADQATTTGIRQQLSRQYPKLADLVLDEENLTLALNEEYVTTETPLKDGDVIALIPPISGG